MMGLDEIIAANKNPQKWREETGRLSTPERLNDKPDHGNYWPGKYDNEAAPDEKGLANLSAAADEGRLINPVPGSEWNDTSEATKVDLSQMQEEISETLHRPKWTLADELARKPESLEFDATKLANEMQEHMAKLAIAYAKLSTAMYIHRNVARLGIAGQHETAHADLQEAMTEAGNLLFV